MTLERGVRTCQPIFCTSTKGRLISEQKRKIAGEITRIHAEVNWRAQLLSRR